MEVKLIEKFYRISLDMSKKDTNFAVLLWQKNRFKTELGLL